MAFDPDAYLSEPANGFDPDAYLSEPANGFDPDAYLSEAAAPAVAPALQPVVPEVAAEEPGRDYSFVEDVKAVLPEVPKATVRGVERLEGSVGNALEAVGDWMQAQGRQWERVYWNSPLGRRKAERLEKEYYALPYEERKAAEVIKAPEKSAGKAVEELGQQVAAYWNEAAETGWEARDPEVYEGDFLENPSMTRVVGGVFESAAPMAVALGLGGTPGAVFLAGTEAAPVYSEAKEMGVSDKDAFYYALLTGAGTGILEKGGLDVIIGRNPVVKKLVNKMGKKWFAGAVASAAAEGTTESLQTIYQNAVAMGYDGDREAFEGALEAGIVGAFMGAGASSGRAAARKAMDQYYTSVADQAKGMTPEQIDQAVRDSMRPEAAQVQIVDAETGEAFRDPAVDAAIEAGELVPETAAEPVVEEVLQLEEAPPEVPAGPEPVIIPSDMRGFAGRISQNEILTPEQQQEVRANPENYYDAQNYEEMGDVLSQMTREQKLQAVAQAGADGAQGNDNLGVMAGMDVIHEEIAAGRDPGWIIETMAKKGTTVAQLLAQYRVLKGAVPEYAVQMFETDLENQGLALKDGQRRGLIELQRADMQAAQAVEQAKQAMRDDPTRQTVNATWRAMRKAEQSKRRLMNELAKYSPKTFAQTYRDIIRGNLLVLRSHKRNVVSNLIMRPIRDAAVAVGSVVDAVDSHISGRERVLRPGTVRGTVKGAMEGLGRAARTMAQGSGVDATLKGEPHRGFKPLSALRQLVRSDLPVDPATGKTPAWVRLSKAAEATLGVAPEVNFRLLALGDEPFKYSAYRAELDAEAKARGLFGAQRDAFVLDPPTKVQQQAMQAALDSVFQGQNIAAQSVGFARRMVRNIPVIGQAIDALVITPTLPYVSTPAVLGKMVFKLAMPEVALATGLGQMAYGKKKGSQSAMRRGEMNLGYATVGAVLQGTALWLIGKGLVSEPPADDEKERSLSYGTTKPGRLNLSALQRYLDNGEPVEWRDGDKTVNLISLGFPGAIINIHNRKIQLQRRDERRQGALAPDEAEPRGLLEDVPDTMVAAVQSTLDQSFVQGIYNVLEAISNDRLDILFQDYMRAATALAPNTLSAITRAQQENIIDTKLDLTGEKGPAIWQAFKNAVNERNPFVDWEQVYPMRFDPLGQPLRRTPEGVPAFMHHLWSDSEPVQMDPQWREIRRLFDATGERDVIPTNPDRSINIPADLDHPAAGEKLPLSNEQYERYNELVGVSRANILNEVLVHPEYQKAGDEGKAAAIRRAISRGSRVGRSVYVAELFGLPVKEEAYQFIGTTRTK